MSNSRMPDCCSDRPLVHTCATCWQCFASQTRHKHSAAVVRKSAGQQRQSVEECACLGCPRHRLHLPQYESRQHCAGLIHGRTEAEDGDSWATGQPRPQPPTPLSAAPTASAAPPLLVGRSMMVAKRPTFPKTDAADHGATVRGTGFTNDGVDDHSAAPVNSLRPLV